jgi:Straboviridae dCMP hydroxymethylase
MRMLTSDVRREFSGLLGRQDFVTDKTGVRTLEIVSAGFVADEASILGEVNQSYVDRELEWYLSQSLSVEDIPPPIPALWKRAASRDGLVNSNYGWVAFSPDNYHQYSNVREELELNPDSRRACIIYNRPSMWYDYKHDGMSDFMCTYAHQYLLRGPRLDVVVFMRSSDAWAGYRNDRAWAEYLQDKMAADLGAIPGTIHWNAGSLHFYEQQFYLIDHYSHTGETKISRKDYDELYPDSPWVGKRVAAR